MARDDATTTRRLGRLERPALTGVLVREVVNFSSYWRSSTFSSTVEPTIYLLAFGFGFGSLVEQGRRPPLCRVRRHRHGSDRGVVLERLSRPCSGRSSSISSSARTTRSSRHRSTRRSSSPPRRVWIATRAGVYGCVPMLVAIAFGLDPSFGMLTVPLIAWVSGFGWACFGIMISGFAKSIENFNYVVSAVLTPLFLVAGTFFPISNLPRWAQVLAELNPLHHCVELVRHAAFGFEPWDVARVGALVLFGLIVWRVAIHAMTRKLID